MDYIENSIEKLKNQKILNLKEFALCKEHIIRDIKV